MPRRLRNRSSIKQPEIFAPSEWPNNGGRRREDDDERWGFAKVAKGGKTAHEQKVLEVEPGSAATAAGVLPKDVVVAVDGAPLVACDALGNFIVGELADKLEATL